jgi:predicted ester cyclase
LTGLSFGSSLFVLNLSELAGIRSPDPLAATRKQQAMTTSTTSATTHLHVLRRIFDEGFATGNAAVVDEVCSPDLVEHQFGLAAEGAAALDHLRAAIKDVHHLAPDMHFTIEDSAVDGDKVWARVRAQGTATGPFFGPPSGRHVDITIIDVCRVVDGRLAEHWGVPDRFALLAQTGVLERLG